MELLNDVWESRDFPVLREVARRADVKPTGLYLPVSEVEEAAGLSHDDVQRAAWWLLRAGLVEVDVRGDSIKAFQGVSSEGRTRVGLWPSPDTAGDRLTAALTQAMEQASTPEEKSRVRKILDLFAEGGKDFAVAVGAGVMTGQLGG